MSDRPVRLAPTAPDEVARLLEEMHHRTLQTGGGGGTFNDMERVAKLEARADMQEQRLDRIENKLDSIIATLGGMPTTNGLWGMIATVIGVGIGIAGLTFAVAAFVAP